MRTRLTGVVGFAAMLMAGGAVLSPALGGDLPLAGGPAFYEDGPLPPQDLFEGWYLGGTFGGATITYDLAPAGRQLDTSGILGGVIGGYSWQSGPFVLGVEGDFLAADISGGRRFNGGANRVSASVDSMADLRLRAGFTVTPQFLLFGTFGGAWANAELPISGPGGGIREADFFGWSAGAGAEVALTPSWSARFDYQFTDFSAETVNYPGDRQTFDPDMSTYRGSIIYRF